jgi:hypothetical protein
MLTYLSDKMPPKKGKIKKQKIRKQFFIITFLGGILSLRQVCFFEISIKFSIFWYTKWPISRKKISHFRRADFKINQHKNQKKIETPQNKEKCLF